MRTNPNGADNSSVTKVTEGASLSEMSQAIGVTEPQAKPVLRQEQDEVENEESEGSAAEASDEEEEETEDEESEESDQDEESDDDEEETEDEEAEENEDTEDEGDEYSGLAQEEAIALLRRQRQGVEKLKDQRIKLAAEVEAKDTELATLRPDAESYSEYNKVLSEVESAPRGVANVLVYVAKTHNIPLEQVVSQALELAKTADPTYVAKPDFEALAKDAAEKAGINEFDDEFERFVKGNTILLEQQWELHNEQFQKLNSRIAESQRNNDRQDPRQKAAEAFDTGFKEAKQQLEADYPTFKLTEKMARDAVKERPRLSVEEAVVAMFHKQMTSTQVRQARVDTKTRHPKMVAKAGTKNGKPGSKPPKSQAAWSMADMERQIKG